jgi:hypothetical protein
MGKISKDKNSALHSKCDTRHKKEIITHIKDIVMASDIYVGVHDGGE